MRRLLNALFSLLGFILLFAALGGTAWLLYQFVRLIGAVPKELGAALVAGATTVLVATATVMIGRYYERKKELDALYRDKKTEIYDEFLKRFFALLASGDKADQVDETDLRDFFREFTRKLILWSGPEVIAAFVAWKDHLVRGVPDAESIFLTEAFVLAIRSDLRNSNQGLTRGFFAKLFLKEGQLLLDLAAKDPKVTLEALGQVELERQSRRIQ